MNKSCFIKLSSLAFVGSLALMSADISAGILNDPARFLKIEMDKAEKRSKFCSAPIYRNIPVLSQCHKAVSNVVGVKSLYKTINDFPSYVADQISDNKIINEGVKIALKSPIKLFITNYINTQDIMRAGVSFVLKERARKFLPEDVAKKIIPTAESGVAYNIATDVAMDVAMGDRPSIAGIIYDNLVKKYLYKSIIDDKVCGVKLYNAYAKAVFCKVLQPIEDGLYRRIREKIEYEAKKA